MGTQIAPHRHCKQFYWANQIWVPRKFMSDSTGTSFRDLRVQGQHSNTTLTLHPATNSCHESSYTLAIDVIIARNVKVCARCYPNASYCLKHFCKDFKNYVALLTLKTGNVQAPTLLIWLEIWHHNCRPCSGSWSLEIWPEEKKKFNKFVTFHCNTKQ